MDLSTVWGADFLCCMVAGTLRCRRGTSGAAARHLRCRRGTAELAEHGEEIRVPG